MVDKRVKVDIWNGEVSSGFESGTGGLSDPYIIAKASQLAYLAQQCTNGNTYTGKYFKLSTDLDLNSIEWLPIGYYDKPFQGIFDGGYHYIFNLKIHSRPVREDAALFGTIKAGILKNTGIIHANIYSQSTFNDSRCPGCFVGYLVEGSTLENCFAQDAVVDATDSRFDDLGGLVSNGGSPGIIRGCYFSGRVNPSGIARIKVGGIESGLYYPNWGNYINVYNSYNNSDLTPSVGREGINKTTIEMKSQAFVELLNQQADIWEMDNGINNGFPVFKI